MTVLAREAVTRVTRLPARLGLRRCGAGHTWIAAASLTGWAMLVALDHGGGLAGLCSAAGWPARLAGAWRAGLVTGRLGACVAMSFAMVVAMTPPLTIGQLRFVARRSFPWRRARAAGLWLVGYLGTWALVAAVMSLVLMVLAPPGRMGVGVAAALGLAASLWQLTPLKRRALAACHRVHPFPAAGRGADAACLASGARIGVACVATCGPVMAAAMASPWPLPALAAAFALSLWERYARRPRVAAGALALAVTGAVLAARAFG